MPSIDQSPDTSKQGKVIKSAFDSESFDADGSIHVDGLVGSATISPSGRDVALASPNGLAIIDLDSPYNAPRRVSSHGYPWLVVDVQWSPFAAREYWVASSANHRVLVWNLNMRDDSESGAVEHSLKGHSRAITDINFSAHHPDVLATCGIDGYINCWDLRRSTKPVLSFCDYFSGATQVKFNRQDPHIIASAHDNILHIWDERKGCRPLKSIEAHSSKIYGIDWNRTRTTGIVTCSLDKSIKFWDYALDTDSPERVIRTKYPVWRARHTPFGWGVLAMPQNEPGELYLYDRRLEPETPRDAEAAPVAVFPAHNNHKVKEFLWRSRGTIDDGIDNREFQLVSWGADNELRLKAMDKSTLGSVGYTKGAPARKNMNITRKGATYKTFRVVEDTSAYDKRAPTMSDYRPGSGGLQGRQSALTQGIRSAGPLHRRSLAPWKSTTMRAKVDGKEPSIPSHVQAQIGWMKGILMVKKAKGEGHEESAIFGQGPGHSHPLWDEPETLEEEFLRISTQLPKVKWENIDLDNQMLNASLNGPWGKNEDSIFIKVKVDIPSSYPFSRPPKVIVETSPFLAEETHRKINRELSLLIHQFLARKQNCLDVVFSYLLGEVDLASSPSFFKHVRDLDDLVGLEDESSSDDDDNDDPNASTFMPHELTASMEATSGALAPAVRPIMPPMPRLCGARFANNGRLVCFFPRRDDRGRPQILDPVPAEVVSDGSTRKHRFAGFGRVQRTFAPEEMQKLQKYINDEHSTTEDSDSAESDRSGSTSSTDSTDLHKIGLWFPPGRRLRKTWSEDRSIRSSGGGTGAGTGTGTGTSKRRPGRPKSSVAIHDVRVELPSKRRLAQEYAIFGDGGEVCDHNARVAERHGYEDLMHVWRYCAVLLRREIPLELLGFDQRRKSVLVIARDVATRFHDDASSRSSHTSPLDNDIGLEGRVRWGQHPLAQDFVHGLFDHYERIADVQMLAMLSCIFSESSTEDSVAYAESHLNQAETPLPMKAPSFSLDYYPSDATIYKIRDNSVVSTPGLLHGQIDYSGSQLSDDMLWKGEPGSNSHSCGETPPKRDTALDYLNDMGSQSLSTSPKARAFQRGNSGFAATLASNFSSRFSSSSPPNPPPKKKLSPAEAMLSNLGSAALGDSGGTARTSISDEELRGEDVPLVPVGVRVTMEDQTVFDDDGWMNVPLLEPSRAAVLACYRAAYAEMLQAWEQPLSRLEILKFNVLKDDDDAAAGGGSGAFRDSASLHDSATLPGGPQQSPPPIALGRREQLQHALASGCGLDVTGVCRVHETQLEPLRYYQQRPGAGGAGGAAGRCERCDATQAQLRCVYCLGPADALFAPCLACGCASHEACLAEWHAAGQRLCPAGDECDCVAEAANGQVESWAAMLGAVRRGGSRGRGLIGAMLPSAGGAAGGTSAGPDEAGDGDVGPGAHDGDGWEDIRAGEAPPARGRAAREALTPARISLGDRLKKSAGEWSRGSQPRKRGGGNWSSGAWRRAT